ncbi:MAG: TIGR03936 family radical SAM-associated protein [Spirochaetales bacterium]|nr:TIGR03936 family radical SAM-associated protein [Spirochaetales bacterium]
MIDLEKQLGNSFLEIENPARYIGSEYIYNQKHYKEGMIKCAMCFPDLYEIGMANNAIRILYDLINRIPEAVCDRVFAVAPDFEALLRNKNIPLFTLQEQFPLNSLDYLGISIGYELSATNILQILDLGKIAIDVKDRKETDPIVIAGGPAATNPLPFSRFFDFVHIGEAEADIADIIRIIGEHKTRSERIQALKNIPYLWYPGKEMAKRAVDTTFGTPQESPVLEHFAISSFETAQDHGTVEIMRGCPNGCRFCHAGQYYKPFRQRDLDTVYDLVEQNVSQLGYREITLSSLSSGDYPGLDKLIKALNESYKARSISFSLPSLRVSTFGLNIIEQLSEVRKSGLTFAIETPLLQNQRSNNKEVPLESVISIIQEARSRGWKLAKFYFMVGLPFVDVETEQQSLVDFLLAIRNATKINMNINIGTFIPKAHTPYQWVRQMTMEESARHLRSIKKALMDAIPGIKVSYHEPSISFLEGLVSRGGYECCDLIQKAYELGCRLDAWDEYIRWDLWQKAIEELSYDISPRSWDLEDELPWDSVSMNVSKAYLKREYEKASRHELTHICDSDCDHRCGVCSKSGAKVIQANNEDLSSIRHPVHVLPPASEYVQTILTYEKTGRAVYNSHIAVMRQFEMAFQRAGLDVMFTQGFNPKPKMEFLNPISMGVCGENELLLCELPVSQITPDTVNVLNKALADGFNVKSIKVLPPNPTGKKISLSSKMKGSVFEISDIEDDEIRGILDTQAGSGTSDFMLERIGEGCYRVTVFGDKNIFKLLFPKEMSKFHIAGSCHIVRKHIDMERI